jgi:RNA polymerase sigma factor (TIGR02999 family)
MMQTGDRLAESELAARVYPELRRQARRLFAQERREVTLQPTALVHEAYLRLMGAEGSGWKGRAHFFAVASIVMRQILVDWARRRKAAKRGGDDPIGALAQLGVKQTNLDSVLIVNEALERLEKIDGRQARIVELRFFGGLTEEEIGGILNISERTVKRDWHMAKAWLRAELNDHPNSSTA